MIKGLSEKDKKELDQLTQEIEENPNVDKNWSAYRDALNNEKKPKNK